ncbi:hypothetical protein HND97_03600 [Vibrio cholerae]|nr:hypothetical protein HND97_03600 [Vibrio cholerae]
MFPKFGAKVPQVRFDGFNSDWEIKEFQSVFVNIRNNSLSRAEINDNTGIGMNVHYGDVLVKFGEILDFTLEKCHSLLMVVKLKNDAKSFTLW